MNWEVRIMRSKISSSDTGGAGIERTGARAQPGSLFNLALFRNNLTRFWPLWALYAIIWTILLPLIQAMQIFGAQGQSQSQAELAASAANELLNMGAQGGLIMAVIFGCLFAMTLFSYLCSPRTQGMLHSFPIRREGIFLTNYLSGAAVFLGANIVFFLLTAVIQGAAGVLVWRNLWMSFASATGTMFFFYSFAVFCAMFTGQLAAIPVFYVIWNGLVAGLNFLIQNFAASFLYGYGGGGSPAWVVWLTPVWKLSNRLAVYNDWDDTLGTAVNYRLSGLGTVGVYAIVGAALALAALLVYRRRSSEMAGDTVALRRVRPVFRWGVAICCALSLGQGLYYLVWNGFTGFSSTSLPGMLVCMILTGLVGYFVAEMLLNKSFRVFRRSWKESLVLLGVLVVFAVCVSQDVTGVVSRVPAADSVESLYFEVCGENTCSGSTTDAALIERFRFVHQALIGEKDQTQARREESDGQYNYGSVLLEYHLRNGNVVQRSYELNYRQEDLKRSDSAVASLAKLCTDPEVQRLSLIGSSSLKHISGGELADAESYSYKTFDATAAQTIYQAVLEDINAGHFGVNQFDPERWKQETYVNTLTIYYEGKEGMDSKDLQFSSNCTALIAALKATGVIDHEQTLTIQAAADDENNQKVSMDTDMANTAGAAAIESPYAD
jgi:ABC-2 type transport system permease protein